MSLQSPPCFNKVLQFHLLNKNAAATPYVSCCLVPQAAIEQELQMIVSRLPVISRLEVYSYLSGEVFKECVLGWCHASSTKLFAKFHTDLVSTLSYQQSDHLLRHLSTLFTRLFSSFSAAFHFAASKPLCKWNWVPFHRSVYQFRRPLEGNASGCTI
jgi:hypothetical protein